MPGVPARPAAPPPRPQVPPRPTAPTPPAQGTAAVPAPATPPPAHVQQPSAVASPTVPVSQVPPVTVQPDAAANAAPVISAAPGSVGVPIAGEGAKKARKPRKANAALTPYHGIFEWQADPATGEMHPVMVKGDDGTEYQKRRKLDTVPSDYDSEKHERLTPRDFVDESVYLDFQIQLQEAKLAGLRQRAEIVKAAGTGETRARANKLLKMRQQMAALTKQLEAEGVNVDLVLGNPKKEEQKEGQAA